MSDAPKTDKRPRLAFAQFLVPARLFGASASLPVVAEREGTELYIEVVHGISCLVVEGSKHPIRGFAPMSNVAAFGLKA